MRVDMDMAGINSSSISCQKVGNEAVQVVVAHGVVDLGGVDDEQSGLPEALRLERKTNVLKAGTFWSGLVERKFNSLKRGEGRKNNINSNQTLISWNWATLGNFSIFLSFFLEIPLINDNGRLFWRFESILREKMGEKFFFKKIIPYHIYYISSVLRGKMWFVFVLFTKDRSSLSPYGQSKFR